MIGLTQDDLQVQVVSIIRAELLSFWKACSFQTKATGCNKGCWKGPSGRGNHQQPCPMQMYSLHGTLTDPPA